MILDGVVGSALDVVSDNSPQVFLVPVLDVEDPFFILAPLVLFYDRVQVVVPSLATLLADTAF